MYNSSSKQVVLLSNRVSSSSPMQPDTPITYANDLDIASDGTIYFTDSVNITTHRCAGCRSITSDSQPAARLGKALQQRTIGLQCCTITFVKHPSLMMLFGDMRGVRCTTLGMWAVRRPSMAPVTLTLTS
jgi:hypothetical protein